MAADQSRVYLSLTERILRVMLAPLLWFTQRPWFRYSTLFYHFEGAFKYFPREEMLKIALRFLKLSKIEGDYLEFGVFQGETLAAAFHLAGRNRLDGMRFIGFDSFEGLPELEGIDREGEYQFRPGEYRCDLESVRAGLRGRGVSLDRVVLVPGWFKDTLKPSSASELAIKKVALAWIDCDLYESTVPVLEYLTPLLQDGTVLIFDDWFCFRGAPDMGEQRACREWLLRNPDLRLVEYHHFGWHGTSFIVNRKKRTENES